MKKILSIFFTIFFIAIALKADNEYVYTVTARVSVPYMVTKRVPCKKRVKKRKSGRWIYVNIFGR